MPAITRSRLDEILALAGEVGGAMGRRIDEAFLDRLGRLAAAVDEVNAALAEVDELLAAGLRDEAISMNDPELVAVARMLDLRSNPEFIRLHGALLERGQSPPAAVNIEAAEQLAAAIEESPAHREDLSRMRRSALERAPVAARLEIARRLRAADQSCRAWIDMVDAHEEARLRELRVELPRAHAAGDFAGLAAMAEELADARWIRQPPSDTASFVAGAREAAELAAAGVEAGTLAAETAALMAAGEPTSPREIDELEARRDRLAALERRSEHLLAALAAHPEVLRKVQERGLDSAIRRSAGTVADALERIRRLAADLKTRRDFESACRQLEHLCDHPPASGHESRWLAELQRSDAVARSACQEVAGLTMTPLLRERTRRAAALIESRERQRRRFWALTAITVAAAMLMVTAVVGWVLWQRAAYRQTIVELERRVAEARAGAYVARPAGVEMIADRMQGDTRVAALVEDFDEAVAAENERAAAFQATLATVGESLHALAFDVEDRQRSGEGAWLEPWPPRYVEVCGSLAAARPVAGLPEHRGGGAADVPLPADARRRLQAEEGQLARAEARLADIDRSLGRLAQQAFTARLVLIEERIAAGPPPDEAQALRNDVRKLRELAAAAKADGLPANAAGPRVPDGVLGTLDPLEKRLGRLGRGPEDDAKGGSR